MPGFHLIRDQRSTHDTRPSRTMKLTAFTCGLLACLVNQVAATALTYKLGASEKACFYATTVKPDEKIAFYFAVSPQTSILAQSLPGS